jgi:glycosyltransferase involved in cell wall biosynthesis
MPKIRIVHIINSFEHGGAESMLCNLVSRMDRRRFEPHVISLIDELTVAGPIIESGVPLTTIGMKPGVPNPLALMRLARACRRLRPDVVQTWMDHSNLIGGVAARVCSDARVVWGVHHADHVESLTKRSTLLTVAACAKLSRRVPTRIVFCSEHAQALYALRGFDVNRSCVVPNGFDTDHFRPSANARAKVRRENGFDADAPLIGLAARYDPVKDHENFLRAAEMLLQTHPRVRFMLCGAGVTEANAELMAGLRSRTLRAACRLLGPRSDIADIYASLDISTSSSISEAFPLAVGEAMACAVPCVATDVGDTRLIVGDGGRVVPARDPAAIAAAWREILALDPDVREALGTKARQRIVERFDLNSVTRTYEQLYRDVAVIGDRGTESVEGAEAEIVAPNQEMRWTPES